MLDSANSQSLRRLVKQVTAFSLALASIAEGLSRPLVAQELPGNLLVRARLADEWLEAEGKSFRRLSRDLGRDEYRQRAIVSELEESIQGPFGGLRAAARPGTGRK